MRLHDDEEVADADQNDRRRSKWWTYPPMPVADRLQWLANLEEYGPRYDFNYYNDDPITEAIRDRYNTVVKDPHLRSEPKWNDPWPERYDAF